MVFLKSADDTVRYSITAFCHVSVYTCHLLALKSTKTFLTTDIKGHVKLISRVVGTPKKRISKAILSSRSEGTMSVTILDVYTILKIVHFFFFSNVKTNIIVST